MSASPRIRSAARPAAPETARAIAVCRPWAPPAAALAPYLERIDAARWYSNFGPLVREFETRLSERFVRPTSIVTMVNGTLALALALRARAPEGGLCLMPSWTFVATAHAAHFAGLTPYLVDVDEATGALTPEIVRRAIAAAPSRVTSVIAVAPYGAPIDAEIWAKFEFDAKIPVVIDAAAGFDAIKHAPVPTMVSLHATKALGVGEGGFIATQDAGLAARIRSLSVFGFAGARNALAPALNAKLSEYNTAVGLAALDCWRDTRSKLMRAAGHMCAAFALSPQVALQPGWGKDWVSATCVAALSRENADAAARRLAAAGIETRRWWDKGVHRQSAFRNAARADALPVTRQLANASLGLPFAIDLKLDDVNRIAAALRAS